MQSTPTQTFGEYLRAKRKEAQRSVRQTAGAIGISHVYLGEVERGVRPPLLSKHWALLIKFLPVLSRATLRRLATADRKAILVKKHTKRLEKEALKCA